MVRHVRQGGDYGRVADPQWADPLDTSYAARRGGRWNPPDSFGVLYLCADAATARANVARLFDGLPYDAEDLDPDRAPMLVHVDVPPDSYVDALSAAGLRALGLPPSYPHDQSGRPIGHTACRPIGAQLYGADERGIAARSAAPAPTGAHQHGRELAWFDHPGRQRLSITVRRPFADWYWH